jgi:hypothetical protein
MMKKKHIQKAAVTGIVILFICGCLQPSLAIISKNITPSLPTKGETKTDSRTVEITCYIVGMQGKQSKQKITIPSTEAEWFRTQLQTLSIELSVDPQSEKIQQLQYELLNFSDTHDLLPAGVSVYSLQSQLKRDSTSPLNYIAASPLIQGRASEWFCNFATFGEGSAFPIIILPRLIPFLLTPIPRAFVWWSTPDGLTSVGGLISRTGFLAGGQQKGIALGFWGIGFSIFLPPIMSYGIFGYALYTRVSAEEFEFYPPNYSPEITQTDPADGQQMVPISTTELRFEISDANSDLMSYNVITEPDIGSGSGGLKPDGTYSIPISGLESLTQYTWYIQVTDGKDTVEKTMTFTTEPVAPVISNPSPADGERHVPTDLQQLQFTLKDFQGDTMDYTVETSPFIGSGSGIGAHNGTYAIAINSLENSTTYRWYINATDGVHWTRKTFRFQTGFPTHFDPFEYGWHYRKQITIDHTNIPEDITNFPVLINIVDNDLKEKTQPDGEDILFMNNIGFATRLNYEIEKYDGTLGLLTAWVNITQLSSNEDTTFYLYYGNPTTLSQQYPEKTWDSNYVAVWHLGESSGSIVADSTSNKITGTANAGATISTGFIGDARNFDGSSGSVNLGTSPLLGGMPTYTIEAWVNPTSISGERRIYDRGQSGSPNRVLFFQDGGKLRFQTNNNDNLEKPGVLSVGTWSHVVGTFIGSGGEIALYVNGIKIITTTSTQVEPTAGSIQTYIGASVITSSKWYGIIDEVRFSKIARTSGWISTSYQNQNDPAGFLNIGPEVPGP